MSQEYGCGEKRYWRGHVCASESERCAGAQRPMASARAVRESLLVGARVLTVPDERNAEKAPGTSLAVAARPDRTVRLEVGSTRLTGGGGPPGGHMCSRRWARQCSCGR